MPRTMSRSFVPFFRPLLSSASIPDDDLLHMVHQICTISSIVQDMRCACLDNAGDLQRRL